MRIKRPEQLLPSLGKEFKPLVWVSGDEPLLRQESADAVRQYYRDEGFLEREVFTVERSFDWGLFSDTTDNLSLFAQRKIIELRLTSPRLEDAGRQALLSYLESPNPDYLLLVTSPRVEGGTLNTRWFKILEAAAWHLQVWPLSVNELPDWLSQRLLKAGLQPSPEALQLLAQRIEGNLLAAVQEIEKLKLLANPADEKAVELNRDAVLEAVSDSSRYNAFVLMDTALVGDSRRALKILQGLKSEGHEPLAILGAACAELRRLLPALKQIESGEPVARVVEETTGRNFKRKPVIAKALRRLRSAQIYALLDQARMVDYTVKGLNVGDPWRELEILFLRLCGTAVPALQRTG